MSDTNLFPKSGIARNEKDRQQAVTREVKAFYEKFRFPGHRPMEQDSLIFFRKFARLVAARPAAGRPLRVFDAGCGTGNTSLALAAQFPGVEFTGVDLSAASIAQARNASAIQDLQNLHFYEWNLIEPLAHEQPFDIVLCFGALHHTAQMQTALQTLSDALMQDGILFLWVYGEYGRYRHTLNLKLLSLLIEVEPAGADPVAVAREFIEKAGDGMAKRDLLGERSSDPALSSFFNDTTWIADQFLNPNEIVVNMRDILGLAKDIGLHIVEWIGVPKNTASCFQSQELEQRFARLSDEQQLIALDLLLKMDRYFLLLEKAHDR
jgi:2-polyprenyl-3-methyl-5-hydroxy-6-metoxy-1,4-benzoquinol methylase